MRVRRVDANHSVLVNEFRKLGARIWDTSALGRGFPDAVVAIRYSAHGVYRMFAVEFKNPDQPPNKQRLTGPEAEFAAYWPPECFRIIRTIEDVTKLFLEHPAAPDGHGDCPWRGELDQCPI